MDNRATAIMLLTVSAAAASTAHIPAMPELSQRDKAPWARKGSRGPGRRRWGGDTKASRRNSPRFTANGRKLKRKKNSR